MVLAASVGACDLALTAAGRALDGINSTTRLHWLLHNWVARSIAGRADMLFDLRTFHAARPLVRPFADQLLGLVFTPSPTSRRIASNSRPHLLKPCLG